MIEINIWDQSFFSELFQVEKLFYWLMVCKCDNVGVYRHNPKLAAFHCEGEIDLQKFVDTVNFDQKRIELLNDSTLWIKDFVRDTWGTITAKNNLGLSCYKLLVKHVLLDRFVSEYPNSINIGSFRDAIRENQKGYRDLPLPQTSPKLAPKQGQGRGKADTININKSINGNISISTDSLFQSLKQTIPKTLEYPEHVLLSEIKRIEEQLYESGIEDVEKYLVKYAKSFQWENNDWDDFTNQILDGKEIPF